MALDRRPDGTSHRPCHCAPPCRRGMSPCLLLAGRTPMSTLEVSYWLRIPEALRPEPAGRPMLDPPWPVRGKIRPNGCPAIRSANQLGMLLFTHHRLTFEGPRDFSLEIIA